MLGGEKDVTKLAEFRKTFLYTSRVEFVHMEVVDGQKRTNLMSK